MSRGPGKWQRLILDTVSAGAWVYLVDLLPDGYSMAQYKAIHRAACVLADTDRVNFLRYRFGLRKVLIGPAGVERPAERPRGYGKYW